MRFNMAGAQKGQQAKILKQLLSEFAEEFDIHPRGAYSYVTQGKQGLTAFVAWLNGRSCGATVYHLPPNVDMFSRADEDDHYLLSSPSYGMIIPDNDPMLVEYKLKYC